MFKPMAPPKIIPIDLPVIPAQIATTLGAKPFQIIADLVNCGYFATLQSELLDDEIIIEVGRKHGVQFTIKR